MNTKEEVLNDIAKEIYGKVYDDLRSVEQDEVYEPDTMPALWI